jgi:hypothetical protein
MKKIFLILVIFSLTIGSFAFAQMGGGDIMTKLPSPEFISPTEGMALKGQIKIEIKVEGANSVEFYLRRLESLEEIYLGGAISPEKDKWEFNWDTTQTPNGSYYLFPLISNQYGQYGKEFAISITVDNEVVRNLEEEATISQQTQQVSQLETQQTQETQTTTQSVTQETQTSTQQAMEPLTEEEKKMVEETLTQSSQELTESLENFSQTVKEETTASPEELEKIQKEKEEIKQEILEKSLAPIKKVEEKVKEEEKPKTSAIREKTKSNVTFQIEELEKKMKELEKGRQEILARISKDSDGDGLPDLEEARLKTSPFNPDTDGDGFLDGIEVATGYDPLKPSPADKIIYQDPRKVEPKESEIYKIESATRADLAKGGWGIKIKGKGRPISFVTLYVYSLNYLVLTTKTDENGNFEYILDKPLEEREHEVYVTVTNNRGEITARSEPYRFIKTPVAIAAVTPPPAEVVSPAETLQKSFAILIIGLIIFAIGVILIVIGILARRAEKKIQG